MNRDKIASVLQVPHGITQNNQMCCA